MIERRLAYRTVRSAIHSGHLLRPSVCEVCGDIPGLGKDGRSKIQAHHHEGYDKPLSVQWLCPACHMAVTPNLNTSNQNKGKTHCKRGHPLSGNNLYLQKDGRQCKLCNQIHSAASYRRRALKEKQP